MDGILSASGLGFVLSGVARFCWPSLERGLEAENVALKAGELRTLVQIAGIPRLTMRGLAGRMGVQPMTASDFVTQLEARGPVERTIDPEDRRARRLEVTAASDRVFRRIAPVALRVHQLSVRRLDEAERNELTRMLLMVRAGFMDPQDEDRNPRSNR
ncbi:MarR family winged helix-turn-helix transcriptional regulator [Antarcticirhabdus aurantiaca]|uniref:MarR family winged helix-turn-helix transcriptional regulator n=1 Tax=Antarcticirhabdus aurantiaca TaxID=2606717 RepID=A0ACD4NRY4_9HYPH|nr:MarR family winged helix-turn-helix transcriptional regulator [Antarcticirhabdus aurantiaca]WAJ29493.1 MarR family winged helix-turn-helix transcriptional regulator [Jeongeuplla avenae]